MTKNAALIKFDRNIGPSFVEDVVIESNRVTKHRHLFGMEEAAEPFPDGRQEAVRHRDTDSTTKKRKIQFLHLVPFSGAFSFFPSRWLATTGCYQALELLYG